MSLRLNEIYKAFIALANAQNMSKQMLSEIVSKAIATSYADVLGYKNVEVFVDHDSHSISTYRVWRIVDRITCPETEKVVTPEISNSIVEGVYRETIEFHTASRQLVHSVSSRINHSLLQSNCEHITDKLVNNTELVSCKVLRNHNGHLDVYLTKYDIHGFIAKNNLLIYDRFMSGDMVQAVVLEAKIRGSNIQAILSRTNTKMIIAVAHLLIKEFRTGEIKIEKLARKPSHRCKIAISSETIPNDRLLQTFLGYKGSSLRSMMQYIGQEKIDVCLWNENYQQVIKNSLPGVEIDNMVAQSDDSLSIHLKHESDIPKVVGIKGVNIFLTGQLVDKKLLIGNQIKPISTSKSTDLQSESF